MLPAASQNPSRSADPLPNAAIPPQSIVGIDFLRGAFAILVLFGHSIESTVTLAEQTGEAPVFWKHFEILFGRGAFWVFGFFVISGFCIQLSVKRSLSGKNNFKTGRYLFARFTRIYPLYAIGLALAVAAWFLGTRLADSPADSAFPWATFTGNLLLVQGFGEQFAGYKPSWSITNEFVYYLALPLLLILSRFRPGKALVMGIIANLALAAVVLTIWKSGGEKGAWLIPFWTLPALSILWFAGALLAEYWERIQNLSLSRWFLPLSGPALLACFAVYAWLNAANAPASLKFLHSYVSIGAFALLILATARMPWLRKPGIARFCRWLGLLSYPLYLFHAPLQAALQSLFHELPSSLPLAAGLAGFFFLPLLVTALAGVPLERFFLKKRKNWIRRFGRLPERSEAAGREPDLTAPTTG